MDETVENVCKKLQCSELASDMKKLNHARDVLSRTQYREIIDRLTAVKHVMIPRRRTAMAIHAISRASVKSPHVLWTSESSEATESFSDYCDEEVSCLEEESEIQDTWLGYFRGFKLIHEEQNVGIEMDKRCYELTQRDCDDTIDRYLREGIRCFLIDLFPGTQRENQRLIVRVRENELKISNILGFPINATLFAKLSPRLQYTGLLESPEDVITLIKGEEVILTTDRYWASRCSKRLVYVNAAFLLMDVRECDFILIGPDIQVSVKLIQSDRLYCRIMEGGKLKSRMPVWFPKKCDKQRMSLEEIEDILFAKEAGINVVVSYIAGTKKYQKNLVECMKLLQCDSMRLCARVVLNEVYGCSDDMNWAVDAYDGFLVELGQHTSYPDENLHLCPAAEEFMRYAYEMQKPIIFDPLPISERRINILADYNEYLFFHPDRFLFRCNKIKNSFYFHSLYTIIYPPMPEANLESLLYCDTSLVGSDVLARNAVIAAFETKSKCIFILGYTGRMAIKVSHFRPKIPIIFITKMKSATEFISLYHNVTMLFFDDEFVDQHPQSVDRHLLFGLSYAKCRKLIKHNDNVVFIYGKKPGQQLPDKYIVYKFDQMYYPVHLRKILFTS